MERYVLSIKMRSEVVDNFFDENEDLSQEFDNFVCSKKYEKELQKIIKKIVRQTKEEEVKETFIREIVETEIKFKIYKKILAGIENSKKGEYMGYFRIKEILSCKEYFKPLKRRNAIRGIIAFSKEEKDEPKEEEPVMFITVN